MLSMDQATAKRRAWNLPFPLVLEALEAKTRQRVIRSDHKPRGDSDRDPNPSKLLGPRFVQVTIDDRAAAE